MRFNQRYKNRLVQRCGGVSQWILIDIRISFSFFQAWPSDHCRLQVLHWKVNFEQSISVPIRSELRLNYGGSKPFRGLTPYLLYFSHSHPQRNQNWWKTFVSLRLLQGCAKTSIGIRTYCHVSQLFIPSRSAYGSLVCKITNREWPRATDDPEPELAVS